MQLEELTITGEQSDGNWHVGMDCIPEEWAALTSLTKLELRGHSLLNVSCWTCLTVLCGCHMWKCFRAFVHTGSHKMVCCKNWIMPASARGLIVPHCYRLLPTFPVLMDMQLLHMLSRQVRGICIQALRYIIKYISKI